MREKLIDYRTTILLSIGTVPCGILGAYITKFLSFSWLVNMFAIFLIFISIKIFSSKDDNNPPRSISLPQSLNRQLIDSRGRVFKYNIYLIPGLIAGCVAGFVSGLLGIGGGTVMVPVMVLLVGMPMHISISASMLIICFTSLSSVSVHLSLGHISFNFAFLLAIGTIIGAQIGARLASKINPKHLRRLFALILIIISLRMLSLGISNFVKDFHFPFLLG